ncbi:unnamed protein product [Spirodela intermedia]|uniref:Uncharacterized protein n=1 Tax=Spirodela intermedia TaxID=51605 RepID=A0A7I8L185_SPIIN|nr:unnamed protein product [Spirodela intermedia]
MNKMNDLIIILHPWMLIVRMMMYIIYRN